MAARSDLKEMKDADRMIQKLREGLQKLVLKHKAEKDHDNGNISKVGDGLKS